MPKTALPPSEWKKRLMRYRSEGIVDLQRLANDLMDRFDNAQQEFPQVLYTDQDCCSQNGPSKFNALFSRWSGLHVCLDIWHFMR